MSVARQKGPEKLLDALQDMENYQTSPVQLTNIKRERVTN
jgi:hypothetical protein